MTAIKNVYARQILDSRGNPTIEVDVTLESGVMGRAAVPSGASTGSKEALELRDHDKNIYMGKGVLKAINNVNNKIKPIIVGQNVFDQKKIDYIMIDADGSKNKEQFGANAILGVSMAVCRAAAIESNKDLYVYLRENLNVPTESQDWVMPTPLMNIINGGAHASNKLDIQEFMIVPHLKESFSTNLRAGVEVFHHLKKVLSDAGFSTNVGDEGGFAPGLNSHEEALDSIIKAIKKAGYKPGVDISISLDSASSEFYKDGNYYMNGKKFSTEEMITYYSGLCEKYPIYSIEDGLDENDHEGHRLMTERIVDKTMLIGDDLFVTNKEIFQEGINNKETNAILIKVNQIGTLTETFETIEMAYKNNYRAVISHRSGETGDAFIADLAVATSTGHIKTGSASRSDRMEKYNQLLRIEESLGIKAKYNPVK